MGIMCGISAIKPSKNGCVYYYGQNNCLLSIFYLLDKYTQFLIYYKYEKYN